MDHEGRGRKRRRSTRTAVKQTEESGNDDESLNTEDETINDNESTSAEGNPAPRRTGPRHLKLADLERHVRTLERENQHLKQSLLLNRKDLKALRSGNQDRDGVHQIVAGRTQLVTEMVEMLNSSSLSLSAAARVWHPNCRISVGVREWDAYGRLEAISLWNMIRSVFANVSVDTIELRPHLTDGEMMLTKWRVQGEVASPAQLQRIIASEDCSETMQTVLKAINSSDLTFTVTTYVIFEDDYIAEQHHCWDQAGVLKRLFRGEMPPSVQEALRIG